MGNDLCTILTNRQLEFKQKHLIVKYNTRQTNATKSNDSTILLTGPSQIYSTLSDQNTLVYNGDMKNSKFHGFGKLYDNGKLYYQGEFKDGVFEGWGVTEKYVGQFREGKYDGYGIYQEFFDQNKEIVTFYYEGYFSHGRYSGNGLEIKDVKIPLQKINQIHKKDGMTDYIQESIQNGNLIAKKYEARQIYIGQFSHGYRNGVGRLFKDNIQLSGTFMAGKTTEKGTIIDPQQEKQIKKRQKLNKASIRQQGQCQMLRNH